MRTPLPQKNKKPRRIALRGDFSYSPSWDKIISLVTKGTDFSRFKRWIGCCLGVMYQLPECFFLIVVVRSQNTYDIFD